MYSKDGVALTNPTLGWRLRATSTPLSTYAPRTQALSVSGRSGDITLPRQPEDAPLITLTVMVTNMANYDQLMVLLKSNGFLTRTADATKQVAVELQSATPNNIGAAERIVEVTVIYRLNGVYWRDVSQSTSTAVTLTTSPQTVNVMSGLTAPVPDALIRVKGGFGNVTVTDSKGSFFSYTGSSLTSTQYLIYNCATGTAVIVNSNTWTGGTPVLVITGPRQVEISPVYATPPMVGQLTVTGTAYSGSPAIEVRGFRAFAS